MSVAAPASIRSAEFLTFERSSSRAAQIFGALMTAADDIRVKHSYHYTGDSDLLIVWGAGSPLRWPALEQQRAHGKHWMAFDLAYWHRDTKVRLTVDAPHPQQWVMARQWPAARVHADAPRVAQRWDASGPVIVAGIGEKATKQYGAEIVRVWELAQIAACRARGATVLYRSKNGRGDVPAGIPAASTAPIDDVLDGASLVVTWHSNVAVDAIRLGIPVVCRDGAAAAVCPSSVPTEPQPLPTSVRDQFLANLAWFQWGFTPHEARGCWTFVRGLLA
jgi:hypothetical protein